MASQRKKIYSVEKKAPAICPVPKNIPSHPQFGTIIADPAWSYFNGSAAAKYGNPLYHYRTMSLERIKAMPVSELAAENAHLWLWCMAGNINEALEVVKAWGFRYISIFVWIKPRLGVGNYLRNALEVCVFAVRGKCPPKCRTQINWLIDYPGKHSEKPRGFISIVEKVSPGPYLELFCRCRPASSEPWWCWGDQCGEGEGEGKEGSDIFIPGYPVPKYSWPNSGINETNVANSTETGNDRSGHAQPGMGGETNV